jgi:hypothetical protein
VRWRHERNISIRFALKAQIGIFQGDTPELGQ